MGVAFFESIFAARMVQYVRRLNQPTGGLKPSCWRSNRPANTLGALDQRAAAEALYTDAAGRSRRALGPEHPETLLTLSRMAAWLAPDRPDQARPIQER